MLLGALDLYTAHPTLFQEGRPSALEPLLADTPGTTEAKEAKWTLDYAWYLGTKQPHHVVLAAFHCLVYLAPRRPALVALLVNAVDTEERPGMRRAMLGLWARAFGQLSMYRALAVFRVATPENWALMEHVWSWMTQRPTRNKTILDLGGVCHAGRLFTAVWGHGCPGSVASGEQRTATERWRRRQVLEPPGTLGSEHTARRRDAQRRLETRMARRLFRRTEETTDTPSAFGLLVA